jgi:hypothetical protein
MAPPPKKNGGRKKDIGSRSGTVNSAPLRKCTHSKSYALDFKKIFRMDPLKDKRYRTLINAKASAKYRLERNAQPSSFPRSLRSNDRHVLKEDIDNRSDTSSLPSIKSKHPDPVKRHGRRRRNIKIAAQSNRSSHIPSVPDAPRGRLRQDILTDLLGSEGEVEEVNFESGRFVSYALVTV